MERIKFRQQAERLLEQLGYLGKVDIAFERERLMSPAVLTLLDPETGNTLSEIETPTKAKLEKVLKDLYES